MNDQDEKLKKKIDISKNAEIKCKEIEEDDDKSTTSTKDDYKIKCNDLAAKLRKKMSDDAEEARRLKKEVSRLRWERSALEALLARKKKN